MFLKNINFWIVVHIKKTIYITVIKHKNPFD